MAKGKKGYTMVNAGRTKIRRHINIKGKATVTLTTIFSQEDRFESKKLPETGTGTEYKCLYSQKDFFYI